ncbi:MAG: site-specific DNA-methyltransferase, partial [Chthoniobacterales bacterium]
MKYSEKKRKPGSVRDAIVEALTYRPKGATVSEIAQEVSARIGETPASSVRSYLRLNTPRLFTKVDRGHYRVREEAQTTLAFPEKNGHRRPKRLAPRKAFCFGNSALIHDDCFAWLATAPSNSVEAVLTDPPYGLLEYSDLEQEKLRAGRGG